MPYALIDRERLFYDLDGEGPPLVMIMGLGGNSQVWAPVRRQLASHHRLVMYDMRGTGRSDVPDARVTEEYLTDEVEALRVHLGLDRIRVLGYSFGTTVALSYATRYPERMHSLVLVSGLYRVLPHAQRFMDKEAEMSKLLPRHLYITQVLLWILSHHFVNRDIDFFDRVALVAERSPMGDLAFQAWDRFPGTIRQSYLDDLAALRCPTRLVHGRYDKVSPLEIVEEDLRPLPHIELRVVPFGGHMTAWDSPDEVAALTVEFFSKH